MRNPLILTTALAGLALASAACGGNDASTQQSATAVRTTHSAAVVRTMGRIERICQTWNASVTGRKFPVDNFDPQHPEAADLPAVGDYFAPAVKAEQTALASLRALTPPAELSQDVRSYTAALAQLIDVVREQVAAAHAADPERFAATLDRADTRLAALSTAADQLEIKSCRAEG